MKEKFVSTWGLLTFFTYVFILYGEQYKMDIDLPVGAIISFVSYMLFIRHNKKRHLLFWIKCN